MTEELPPIIKTLESLVDDLVEYDQQLQTLEHDRELSEERLGSLLNMAKTVKEIGADIKYPLEQIKELDGALSEIIESIKLQVAERAVIECEFNKVKAEVEADGWTKKIYPDMSCEWIKKDDEPLSNDEFIKVLKGVKEWGPKGWNQYKLSIVITQIDIENTQVQYDVTIPEQVIIEDNMIIPTGSSRMCCSFAEFQTNFKPMEEKA